MPQPPDTGVPSRKVVAAALERSKLLNASAKRHWRSLLPHMSEPDLRELWQILAEADDELRRLDEPAEGETGIATDRTEPTEGDR